MKKPKPVDWRDVQAEITTKIEHHRARLFASHSAFAKAASVSPSYWSEVRRCKKPATMLTLTKLARAAGLKFYYRLVR